MFSLCGLAPGESGCGAQGHELGRSPHRWRGAASGRSPENAHAHQHTAPYLNETIHVYSSVSRTTNWWVTLERICILDGETSTRPGWQNTPLTHQSGKKTGAFSPATGTQPCDWLPDHVPGADARAAYLRSSGSRSGRAAGHCLWLGWRRQTDHWQQELIALCFRSLHYFR